MIGSGRRGVTSGLSLPIIFLMSLTPRALVLLHAQRHHLDDQPHEREVARRWTQAIDEARGRGERIVLIQWDGEVGGEHPTFSRGWTLYPDFRAEEGDLLLRAVKPDAFASSNLDAELRARAVQELYFLALEGLPEAEAMAEQARGRGYTVAGVERASVA